MVRTRVTGFGPLLARVSPYSKFFEPRIASHRRTAARGGEVGGLELSPGPAARCHREHPQL